MNDCGFWLRSPALTKIPTELYAYPLPGSNPKGAGRNDGISPG
jgi:hypothetical protein